MAPKFERFSMLCYLLNNEQMIGWGLSTIARWGIVTSKYTDSFGVSQTHQGWTDDVLLFFDFSKGYFFPSNHGSGKWLFWRLNSSSRAVFSTSMILKGRAIYNYTSSHANLTPQLVAQANESTNRSRWSNHQPKFLIIPVKLYQSTFFVKVISSIHKMW